MTDIVVHPQNVSISLAKFQQTNKAGNWLSDIAEITFEAFQKSHFLFLSCFCVVSGVCSPRKYVKRIFHPKRNILSLFTYFQSLYTQINGNQSGLLTNILQQSFMFYRGGKKSHTGLEEHDG